MNLYQLTSGNVYKATTGAGGYIVPPKEFFNRLVTIAREHNIILIMDEVQTGFARTGTLFACEQFVTPDMLCLAKSIAGRTSGYELGL